MSVNHLHALFKDEAGTLLLLTAPNECSAALAHQALLQMHNRMQAPQPHMCCAHSTAAVRSCHN